MGIRYLAWLGLLWVAALSAQEVRIPIDNYPPWKIVEGNEIRGGVDLVLTTALLDKLGLRPKYVIAPWKRGLQYLETGEVDLVSGIIRNPEREVYLSFFSFPYKDWSNKVFLVRRGEGGKFSRLADFEGKLVATLRGARHFSEFDQNQKILRYDVNSEESALAMLTLGRVDAAIMSLENGRYYLARQPEMKSSLEYAKYVYREKVEVFFAISRRSPLLARQAELETALRKMIANGEVARIFDQLPH